MDGQYRLAVGVHGRHHAAGRKFFTNTNFKSVNLGGGSESRHNENNKVEFISWWSF